MSLFSPGGPARPHGGRRRAEPVRGAEEGPARRRGGASGRGEPTSRGSPRTPRRPDIQGLRAVAVLAVVAFHAGLPPPGGFVGVDMFFVVSGFVITAMLEREWAATGRIAFGRFCLRRFTRLAPALALTTAVTVIVAAFLLSPLGPQQTAGKTAVGAMLLVANFVIARATGGYFDAAADMNPLLHTWSLSVEEQFYLLFPALLAGGWALARHRARVLGPLVIVAAVATVSFTLAAARSLGHPVPLAGFYSPLGRAWEFAVGAVLALALRRRRPRSPRVSGACGCVGLILVAASILLISERTPLPGLWTLLPVTGTLLLLLSGADPLAPTARLLAAPPMARIGDWSYSIYLWHWPLIVFAGLIWPRNTPALVAAAVLSLAPAVASHTWVEQPIRHIGLPTRRRWAALAAAVMVPPLLLGAALWSAAASGWWSAPVREMQAATTTFHHGRTHNCDSRKPLPADTGVCGWNQGATGAPIYLLGDSHADHFSEGFIKAAEQLGRPLSIAVTSGCPFVDVVVDKPPSSLDDRLTCQRYVRETSAHLAHARPGLVVISNTDRYWGSEDLIRAGSSGSRMSDEPGRKTAAFREGLLWTVQGLRKAGHQVLLVQTAPRWGAAASWDPTRCAALSIMARRCSAQIPLAVVNGENAAVRSAVEDVARRTDSSVWDPAIALCPGGTCSTAGPSFTRYRDPNHISVRQAIELTPAIEEAITAAGSAHRPPA